MILETPSELGRTQTLTSKLKLDILQLYMTVLFRFALKIEAELRNSFVCFTATRSTEALKLVKVRQKLLYRVELTEPDEDGVTPLDLEKCMKVR